MRKQEYVIAPAGSLSTWPGNPRKGDISVIRESIKHNGFYGALVVQKSSNKVIAGNHRFLAGKEEGMVEFPVVYLDVSDDQAARINLADNRTSDIGEYDNELLLNILQDIENPTDGTGYSKDSIDVLQRVVMANNTDPQTIESLWKDSGMPEYSSDNKQYAFQTTIAFATHDDADEFFRLIDRPKLKKFWYPQSDGFVGLLSDVEILGDES